MSEDQRYQSYFNENSMKSTLIYLKERRKERKKEGRKEREKERKRKKERKK